MLNKQCWGVRSGKIFHSKFLLNQAAISLSPFCVIIAASPIAVAQVTFDGTLRNVLPGTTPGQVEGFTYEVRPDQGLLAGDNLFHSFSQFNLIFGESIRFESSGARNIVTRVTGGNASSIAGEINVDANFYLINPGGIIFNDGAEINLNGADREFYASTANGLFFEDGLVEFSAVNPDSFNVSLLTIGADPGNFDRVSGQAEIQINSALTTSENLSLLYFDAGDLNVSNSGFVGNTSFTPGIELPGGLLLVEADNVYMTDSAWSTANSVTTGSLGGGLPSGGIAVFSNGQVIFNNSILTSASIPGEEGDAGLVLIGGDNLVFENFTQLQAQTSGAGQAGVIALFTNDRQGSITFRQSSAFSSIEPPGVSGDGISPSTFAELFAEESGLLSDIFFRGSGYLDEFSDFFYILVDTGTLTLEDNSSLQTLVRGRPTGLDEIASGGTAGWIGISANNVLVDSSAISSEVFEGASAPENRAGAVALDVDNLLLTNDGELSASLASEGVPGVVAVNASGDVALSDSQLSSEISSEGVTTAFSDRFGGGVEIIANRLLLDNSKVTVANDGIGDAGDVALTANVIGLVNGSEVRGTVTLGEGGNVNLTSRDFLILDSASNVTVDNRGLGNAGSVLALSDVIVLNQDSEIRAETVSASRGGNIGIGSNFLILANDSNVTTDSQNVDGTGGNILLEVPGIIYATPSRDSNIRAEGRNGGQGGVITFLSAPFLANIVERERNFSESNDITTFGAVEGEVGFRSGTQDVNPVQEQVTLPTNLIDASRLIAQGCAAGNLTAAEDIGELVLTGRGGVPPSPSEQISDAGAAPELIDVPGTEVTEEGRLSPIAVMPHNEIADTAGAMSLVEAQSWRYEEDGTVILTASADVAPPIHSVWRMPGCNDEF